MSNKKGNLLSDPMLERRSTASLCIPCEEADFAVPSHAVTAVTFPVAARLWSALAVGSLVIAGLLSLAVVVGRLPWISPLIADPLFFKRCLVVHVNLALSVWFYAFLAALAALRVPAHKACPASLAAPVVATVGVLTMVAGTFAPGAQPVLANYIPVIDHPVFLAGLATFFVAVVVYFLHNLTAPSKPGESFLPEDVQRGVLATGVAIVLAATTYIASWTAMPDGLDAKTFFEQSTWGAGHVLQVANVCGLLAVWLWMLHRVTGRPVLTARTAGILFAILLAPHFASPLLTARGVQDMLYVNGMTELMRWGYFPIVLLVLVLGLRHVWRQPHEKTNIPARALRAGFLSSAALILVGISLGFMIRESTTLIPAHYHAALGAMTAAFMAGVFLLIEASQPDSANHFTRLWRGARHQLPLYGFGQLVFAAGFAIGGFHGLGRKAYGAEQHVRSLGEITGLIVMGLGGLLAILAGLWFLYLALREMKAWATSRS